MVTKLKKRPLSPGNFADGSPNLFDKHRSGGKLPQVACNLSGENEKDVSHCGSILRRGKLYSREDALRVSSLCLRHLNAASTKHFLCKGLMTHNSHCRP